MHLESWMFFESFSQERLLITLRRAPWKIEAEQERRRVFSRQHLTDSTLQPLDYTHETRGKTVLLLNKLPLSELSPFKKGSSLFRGE